MAPITRREEVAKINCVTCHGAKGKGDALKIDWATTSAG